MSCKSIFVVRDGGAGLQPVTVGRKNDQEAEILKGLGEGDLVIIHPGNDVTDGARVVQRD